jgi:F-type H+-transporting ATPase subunit b
VRRCVLQFAALGILAGSLLAFQVPKTMAAGFSGNAPRLVGGSSVPCLAVLAAQQNESESQPSGTMRFFEWLNFVILVGGLIYLLRKPLASFFTGRSAEIVKALDEGRKALDESVAKLKAIEQKLAGLKDEVEALRAQAAKDIEAEADRMRQQTVTEAERVSESARAQIEAATRAAKVELKAFAANQAAEIAEQMVRTRLDRENQGKLVERFFEGLNGKQN